MTAAAREAARTRAIRALLRQAGCWEVKVLGGLGQRPGVPDVLACCRGRFVAVEVKRPGRQPTARQAAELAAIQAAGGLALVATSAAEVAAALQALAAAPGGQLPLPWEGA